MRHRISTARPTFAGSPLATEYLTTSAAAVVWRSAVTAMAGRLSRLLATKASNVTPPAAPEVGIAKGGG